ncbi:hypothetical protein ACFZBU_24555 [Embleya sp. NPDC008237]|uniref:SecDF P1 head subdomain-containing protein n=1 Tax=Embleya sp. NPDC008237 TaxID=3363978 RepID=UPI0036EE7186
MTLPSRHRLARSLVATAAVTAVLLGAAGCSSDDPVGFKDGDRSDSVEGTPGRSIAEATLTPEAPLGAPQLTTAGETIRKRATSAGLPVKDITVRNGALVVRISSTKFGADTKQRLAAIAGIGQLTVRPVAAVTALPPANAGPGGATTSTSGPECENAEARQTVPPDAEVVACDGKLTERYVLAPAVITRTDVAGAEARAPEAGNSGWTVTVKWTNKGQNAFTQLTSEAAGGRLPTNRIAIVCDGRVLVAPSVQSVIPGEAVISGTYDEADARQLAGTLDGGVLPAGFRVESYVEGQ